MAKVTIVTLMGLPGAGKTRFSSELKCKLNYQGIYKVFLIKYDDIITKNHKNDFKSIRKQAYQTVESILHSMLQPVHQEQHHVILIDDNMYYRSMRYQYYKLARQYGTAFLQIYLKVPLTTALKRNDDREPEFRVPRHIVEDMASKLEEPGNKIWELNSVTLNSDIEFNEKTYETLLNVIDTSPNISSTPLQTRSLTMTKLQTIDLLLRKIVHEKMKINRDNTDCLKRKKAIFKDIKSGKVSMCKQTDHRDLSEFLINLF